MSSRGGKERASIQRVSTATFSTFRNSKLTLLLSDSLTGNSKMFMVATLSPARSAFDENMSTLRFAATVGEIEVKTERGIANKAEVTKTLESEVQTLRDRLASEGTVRSKVFREQLGALEALCVKMGRSWDDATANTKEQAKNRKQSLELIGLHLQSPRVVSGDIDSIHLEDDNVLGSSRMQVRRGSVTLGSNCEMNVDKAKTAEEESWILQNASDDPLLSGTIVLPVPSGQVVSIGSRFSQPAVGGEPRHFTISGLGITPSLCILTHQALCLPTQDGNHSISPSVRGKLILYMQSTQQQPNSMRVSPSSRPNSSSRKRAPPPMRTPSSPKKRTASATITPGLSTPAASKGDGRGEFPGGDAISENEQTIRNGNGGDEAPVVEVNGRRLSVAEKVSLEHNDLVVFGINGHAYRVVRGTASGARTTHEGIEAGLALPPPGPMSRASLDKQLSTGSTSTSSLSADRRAPKVHELVDQALRVRLGEAGHIAFRLEVQQTQRLVEEANAITRRLRAHWGFHFMLDAHGLCDVTHSGVMPLPSIVVLVVRKPGVERQTLPIKRHGTILDPSPFDQTGLSSASLVNGPHSSENAVREGVDAEADAARSPTYGLVVDTVWTLSKFTTRLSMMRDCLCESLSGEQSEGDNPDRPDPWHDDYKFAEAMLLRQRAMFTGSSPSPSKLPSANAGASSPSSRACTPTSANSPKTAGTKARDGTSPPPTGAAPVASRQSLDMVHKSQSARNIFLRDTSSLGAPRSSPGASPRQAPTLGRAVSVKHAESQRLVPSFSQPDLARTNKASTKAKGNSGRKACSKSPVPSSASQKDKLVTRAPAREAQEEQSPHAELSSVSSRDDIQLLTAKCRRARSATPAALEDDRFKIKLVEASLLPAVPPDPPDPGSKIRGAAGFGPPHSLDRAIPRSMQPGSLEQRRFDNAASSPHAGGLHGTDRCIVDFDAPPRNAKCRDSEHPSHEAASAQELYGRRMQSSKGRIS